MIEKMAVVREKFCGEGEGEGEGEGVSDCSL